MISIPVRLIGWKVLRGEPAHLWPQFDNPVSVRVFAGSRPLGPMEARLRGEGERLIADIDLPNVPGEVITAFCITDIEHDPFSGLRRRRVSSIDVKIEWTST